KTLGDTVAIDVSVNPESNIVTVLRMQIKYDPTKLQPVTGSVFTPTTSFPAVLEGPIVNNGTIAEVISTGINTTKAIRTITKAGTYRFKTIAVTPEDTPTVVSFTNQTQAYSAGPNDH